MARATKPQVVVITGASAGVGRATARAYGARGASVGLIARGCDGLEAACREIEELGGRAVIAPADVVAGRDPQLERAVQEAMKLLKERPPQRVPRPSSIPRVKPPNP